MIFINFARIAYWLRCLLIVILLCYPISGVRALWAAAPSVPLERLLKNVQAYISKNPNDATGYYVLGRLHSLAFAKGTRTIEAYEAKPNQIPKLPSYDSIIVSRTAKDLKPEAKKHLLASIHNYQKATDLDSKHAMSFLGLGWVLEDGAKYADKVEPFPKVKKPEGKTAYWQARALAAYRQAYQLTVARDLQLPGLGPGADDAISLEAGNGIIRLLRTRKLSDAERNEIAQIEKTNETIEQKPRAVTPIIFPLAHPSLLSTMLTPDKPVRFDLAGDGKPAWWPWVKPEVGILVWNPSHNGRITSGLQLFGSVTWWIAWANGYEPLAMLDDNGDGWLSGKEADALAVWRDANSNGVSEPGEVVSLSSLGIRRIAARAMGQSENTLFNPRGIQLRDGRYLPTYDWTPTAVKMPGRADCD